MKNYIILSLSAAMFLVACQPAQVTETSLDKLVQKRDSIQGVLNEVAVELKIYEAKIAEQDTVKKAPLVASEVVGRSEFNHYFKVQGNVESDKSATLFPETQGIVKAIYVKEGQKVSAGQRLLALDNDIIASNISEVETSLSLATEMFERQERLWNQNIGSEMQFIEAKSRKESMEKTIATLRKQQSMAVLKAPFSGVVDKIYPKIGEMGSPMSPAVSVVNLNELHAVADVSEKYLIKVKPNAPVRISFGEGMETLNGNIKNIGATINSANRTFEIKVGFAHKADFLRPNLMAEVEINDFKADSAIVIPSSNILQDIDGKSFVYCIMQEGTKHIVRKTIVDPGITYRGKTMILSGLNGGESIVTEGARKLVDGKEIRLN
jgi:membrane fusion protein (multidrug efflux system)